MLRFALQLVAALALLATAGVTYGWVAGSGLSNCGIDVSESAAIATLKNLRTAQQQFVDSGAVDLDGDGRGEPGTIGELSGAVNLRQSRLRMAPPHRIAAPVLGPIFARGQDGRVEHWNYRFQLWLQGVDGLWVGDDRVGSAVTGDWCAYAWPATEEHGRRTFFLDGRGNVWSTTNADRRYGGAHVVPVDAALPSSDAHATTEAGARVGRDGMVWVCVD